MNEIIDTEENEYKEPFCIVIDFDECLDPAAAFFALYAGLRMYKEQREKRVPEGMLSFVAAEASCILEMLEENFPSHYIEAVKEFDAEYGIEDFFCNEKYNVGYTCPEGQCDRCKKADQLKEPYQ